MALEVVYFLNGDYVTNGATVDISDATTIQDLFEKAVTVFNLNALTGIVLNRVFLASGEEISDLSRINSGDKLYFSAGEDFTSASAAQTAGDESTQEQQAEPTYLYSAALFTAGMVSAGYGMWSNAVRTHAPQQVVNFHNAMEETAATYAKPLIEASLPYLSQGVTWSDKQLNHCIEVTTEKTHEFLETDAGKKISEGVTNVRDYSTHAVESFKTTMNNARGSNNTNSDGSEKTEEQHQASYVDEMKQRLGSAWNDSLLPLVNNTYNNLKQQVGPYVPQQQEGQEEKKDDTTTTTTTTTPQ